MQILTPNYILTPNTLLVDMSVAFDKTIHKIAPLHELKKEFPEAEVIELKENSLLMPGLINAHVHVEFSANKTTLSYGDFIPWLYSVIENRDELINGCNSECMERAINSMLESGITTFGAVSSHGMDLQACANASQNVVFFNELIGSQATMADALFGDFLARLDASKSIKREGFYTAVAIHSPYSVHPILIKKALQIVKNENLKLTAHFMESNAEREWLDESKGDFKDFFQNLLKQNSAVSDSDEFLENFNRHKTLLTHVVKANENELKTISSNSHTVIHCPISNRLLGNGALDLKKLQKHNIRWICATDGLSSNYKLDLFEEMKCALFMHSNMPLLDLAKKLINSVTVDAADALGISTGEISEGKNADMLIIDLDKKPSEELAIHLILHRYNISKIYINGILKKGS
ncbi:MAG: chlorohydrolase [Sulfurimonas sp. RIFOXYD12_FULL_33_39]|uniref:aminofutalosine deaminase family hydrolase n=1 Tax=unclassified Sulfurimonas TaxID=2623549 RepID=UPI0008B1469F|nr:MULTISPECIES: metal-dependent hydrolase [unclassified Sulfurimonas]OHE05688.1 MAG: chlorohydrolase [Sulfurimonas sp. RIFCSPLOWO2_12_FULL_34_6]OHE10646.1 MAG: chlorohydrolase [Sulfurimonas sp. RIFOXYD12_FULL_33_39]OHE13159.1 MAG: chlorohydrolase [Sulfurimonas sp. RIFOXYD2_FULL_34_21]DAB27720.1 MAG TPA: chlorohydrolase [Sulfurimonas sp. UBA10385]